ncbi:Uncharacterised protein [Burkholderia pseudomallei]|uniref:hypothetical protein n=1 Tax=Burkholderia pseudomallei TaxID=28450 RepID=UPI000975A652|nr:hypothetical protein [Burkholderia pseudomallei]AYX34641.1 hypothetical protein EGY15_05285 [Burkholderia pseudomallei]MBO2953695.1 hypothetical protein [Burkholderia pseudomallei]OMT50703.1 hypothetical protein AQ759_03340 [Burkholderia pseudomallei]OMT58000.1 hypothetical protein AQ761_05380 [Burkholderia pseudomallei]ONE03100.1 hypothetical protein AQ943_01245 [Burkholderia pseudomallei]
MRAIRIIDLPPRRGSLLCEFGAVAGITAISLMVVMYRYRQRRQRERVPPCWIAVCAADLLPNTP